MPITKLTNFTRKEFVYKIVNDQPIEAAVCVPRNASGRLPLLVHWHGGGLVIGEKLYEPWLATWLVQLAELKKAVIVSANYRLLPEATGKDIIEDLTDFYDWVQKSLPTKVSNMSNGSEVDLNNILVAGESAGGYLAVQSALLFPSLNIKAVISRYGALDLEHPKFNIFPNSPSPQSQDVLEEYLKASPRGTVRTTALPDMPWVWPVFEAIMPRFLDFFGREKELFTMKLVGEVKRLPAIWVLHGKEDDMVVPEIAENFVEKVKQTHPEVPIWFTMQPGGHGFDTAMTLDQDWAKEGCDFISKFW